MSEKELKERDQFRKILSLEGCYSPTESSNELAERLNLANQMSQPSFLLLQGGVLHSQENIASQNCSVKAVFSQSQTQLNNEQNEGRSK